MVICIPIIAQSCKQVYPMSHGVLRCPLLPDEEKESSDISPRDGKVHRWIGESLLICGSLV